MRATNVPVRRQRPAVSRSCTLFRSRLAAHGSPHAHGAHGALLQNCYDL